ncbi:MAG: class I SAM-dependent methyltransferase [Anaerolineae bacterium]|nr:MAG: class I SAM-dependent methyltransferase [Anaerolineae bacterium]
MNRLKRWVFNLWYWGSPPWDTGVSPPELLQFLAQHPPGRALDLGCGTGTNVITLAQHGWEAVGVDFAPRAIRRARRKARAAGVQAEFYVDDVTRLRQVTPPFDLVLDIGCYHGLSEEEQERYLARLLEVLAPAGHFLLYVFFRPQEQSPRPGVVEADLARLEKGLQRVWRQDGRQGDRPAAWLLLRKP